MTKKIDFKGLSIGEKLEVIQNQFESLQKLVDKIKPECFIEESEEEPPVERKRLGESWINLKDADQYNWYEYFYEDFVVGLWYCDPNFTHYSGSACDRAVGFPAIDKDVIPKEPDQWTFGDGREAPEWFNDDNIKEGNIWVKLLCVHADPKDNEDDD